YANDALFAKVLIIKKRSFRDLALMGQSDHITMLFNCRNWGNGRDALAIIQADEIHNSASLGISGRLWNLVDFLYVDLTQIAEEEDVCMGRSNKQLTDPVVILRLHAAFAFASALLRLIGRSGCAFDVARMRNGDDHVLFLNQILNLDLGFVIFNSRAAILTVTFFDVLKFGHDQRH